MKIKVIIEPDDIKAYYQLLNKAISEESQFFRVSPIDIVGEVFPTSDTFDNFTLGAIIRYWEQLVLSEKRLLK